MGDVNGQSYWQWVSEADFDLSAAPSLQWNASRNALVLQGHVIGASNSGDVGADTGKSG